MRNTWMGVSHLAGGAVRRVGHSAADLEPEHRRDGMGFALIALAVVVAAREWWGVAGTFGQIVHAVFAGTFGRVAYAVPLVLLALGLRMLRAPQDEAATNRIVVGTIALTFAACGLSHLADGIPNPPDGAEGMRAAGGILGFLASSPLAAAVSTYGAVAILVPARPLRSARHHGDPGQHDPDPDAPARGPSSSTATTTRSTTRPMTTSRSTPPPPRSSGPAASPSTCPSARGDEAFRQAAQKGARRRCRPLRPAPW